MAGMPPLATLLAGLPPHKVAAVAARARWLQQARPKQIPPPGDWFVFLAMADRALQDGFLRAPHRKMMLAEKDPACLLELLHSYSAPVADKWVENSAR